MDITLAIETLGLSHNRYRLDQSVPPHQIIEWADTNPDPQPTEVELTAGWNQCLAKRAVEEAVAVRDGKLMTLVHDFGDGRVIQCRDPAFSEDESRMRNAIELMERHGITQRIWYMADNAPGMVTVADLRAAIHSGQDQADAAWAEFFVAIGGGA